MSSSELHVVRSPFIGTFYRAPSPNSAVFAEVGQSVQKGQVLCIVEAMKIMNEIEADAGGVIEKIFIENGSPVDFNAALFAIRKS
jgi:acetyl-CoA carboxylase biotin carboxyl carrier protein